MRRGMGTLLGILIFVGILFSSIIPLQLYVKANRNLLLSSEREAFVGDEYREQEDIYVLAYPINATSDQLCLRVENKGAIPVVIKNVWIKDAFESLDFNMVPGQEEVFGPFTVVLEENSSYPVKVVTDRGRIFSSDTGNLAYIEGTWVTPSLGVSVQIANNLGKYYIKVSNETWSSYYQTQGMDQDDVLVFFDVKTNGEYYVVCKKNSSTGPDLPGTPMMVEILYPGGPPVVFIYTSGYDV